MSTPSDTSASPDSQAGTGTEPAPALADKFLLWQAAEQLVNRASRLGFVITIEQRPLRPLAMGHHESVVTVREARR